MHKCLNLMPARALAAMPPTGRWWRRPCPQSCLRDQIRVLNATLAEALAAMGDSNAANWAVVQKAVPHLIQMLRAPDLHQVEAGVRFRVFDVCAGSGASCQLPAAVDCCEQRTGLRCSAATASHMRRPCSLAQLDVSAGSEASPECEAQRCYRLQRRPTLSRACGPTALSSRTSHPSACCRSTDCAPLQPRRQLRWRRWRRRRTSAPRRGRRWRRRRRASSRRARSARPPGSTWTPSSPPAAPAASTAAPCRWATEPRLLQTERMFSGT